jgi:hypothetical protein
VFYCRIIQLLTYVTNPGAEFVSALAKQFVACKQMIVSRKHRPATAGIGYDWSDVGTAESFDVLASENAGAVEIPGMCMKRTTTNLMFWRFHCEAVGFQNASRRFVNAGKKALTDTTGEQHRITSLLTELSLTCAGSVSLFSGSILKSFRGGAL